MSGSRSLVLATSNGTGMGHLARQLSIALASGTDTRAVLFSLSVALPTATTLGIAGEYCPGLDRRWMPEVQWPHYLASRLEALVNEIDAEVVVFDGVAPYRGITLAKKRLPNVAFVWFRRGMWRPGVNEGQLWKSNLFDQIIEPSDVASEADRGATSARDDALRVSPVSLIEVLERPDREEAAAELGVDPSRPTALITLGSGRLGDVASPGTTVLRTLLDKSDWQICVATSAIATSTVPLADDSRVTELKGLFPLARYLDAFDAVVSSAGYNAVHENLGAGLPTLLVPNKATKTDDQVSRARWLNNQGLALMADLDSSSDLEKATEHLLDPVRRRDLKGALDEQPREKLSGGAAGTAAALRALADGYEPQPLGPIERLLALRDDAKEALKRRLGPQGTNLVRRALGREPIPAAGRLKVSFAETPREGLRKLVFTERPTTQQLTGDDVVEHLLEGSSPNHRAARALIADRHFDIVTARPTR